MGDLAGRASEYERGWMSIVEAFQVIADATGWSVADLELIIAACGEARERERIVCLARWKARGYSGRFVINLKRGHIIDVRLETTDIALERVLTSSGIEV